MEQFDLLLGVVVSDFVLQLLISSPASQFGAEEITYQTEAGPARTRSSKGKINVKPNFFSFSSEVKVPKHGC